MNFVCIVFELTLSSMESLIVQCNLIDPSPLTLRRMFGITLLTLRRN